MLKSIQLKECFNLNKRIHILNYILLKINTLSFIHSRKKKFQKHHYAFTNDKSRSELPGDDSPKEVFNFKTNYMYNGFKNPFYSHTVFMLYEP